MEKTEMEKERFALVEGAEIQESKKNKVNDWFWYRRLINCEYFKRIYEVVSE
jgi:hypothetical protein